MKILLVIDHCGLGGAQRQVVELACGLKQRGHATELFIYAPQYDFFRPRLAAQQIPVHSFAKGVGASLQVIRQLRALIRRNAYDFVVAYLNGPNLYAELAMAGLRGPKLIVSERCSHHDDRPLWRANVRRLFHAISDHIVTNSHSHARWLNERPLLRGKASCIYNGVDLDSLRPAPVPTSAPMRLLAVGRVCEQKNAANLIAALDLLARDHGSIPEIDWVGKIDTSGDGGAYARKIEAQLEATPSVREHWHWLGERSDIPALLREHHALIHPSFYEGLPNAVCEALAAGVPVLVSDVCDHALLVADGQRGFLFDPADPRSIASAIRRFTQLGAAERQRFSAAGRRYAEETLGLSTLIDGYERLFAQLLPVPVGSAPKLRT